MSRRLILAAVAVAALAPARPAAADGFYFLEGIGMSKYGDELGEQIDTEGLNLRVAIGRRMDNIAVEAWFRGELGFDARYSDGLGNDLLAYGLDLKVIQPISKHWSVYARGGLSRMFNGEETYSGRGLGATAGIQVAGKVPALGYLWWPLFFLARNVGPKVHSGVWFEMGHSFYRLHGRGPSIDATVANWTLGFSVGQDF